MQAQFEQKLKDAEQEGEQDKVLDSKGARETKAVTDRNPAGNGENRS